jgi:WD40 repeat protein
VAQTPAGAWLPRALALRAGGHQLLVGRCWTLADDTSAGIPQCSNADIQRWDVNPASDAIDKDTRMAAELQRPIAAHLLESQNIAMAVGGERVAMANRDSITVWDLSDRQPTTITHTPFSTLGSLLARDPQQTTVAAVACDGEQDSACPKGIVLLHAADGTPLGPLLQGERHKGNVTSLVFNSDGTSLASAGDDGVLLWDVPSQRQVGQRLDTGNVVRALAFGAPQGRQRLALVDDTRTVTLWDPDSGRQVTTPQRMQTDATLRSLAFSTDGQLLAAGTDDGRILLWDPATGELALPPLTGQFGQVRLLGFTAFAGMRLLASVDQANQITVWDVDAGRALASPPNHHEELVTGVDFHTDPNSHDLVMVSHDTQNDVSWTLQLDEQRLQQRVCTLVWRDLYPEEKRRFLHLDFPFPSSVVEPWFFSFEPVSCPGPGAPTTS